MYYYILFSIIFQTSSSPSNHEVAVVGRHTVSAGFAVVGRSGNRSRTWIGSFRTRFVRLLRKYTHIHTTRARGRLFYRLCVY